MRMTADRFEEIYEATKQAALRYISSKCLNITEHHRHRGYLSGDLSCGG